MIKMWIAFLLTVLLFPVFPGADISDGLYTQFQDEAAPEIVTYDGKKLRIGAKCDLKIEKAELFSTDNLNNSYHLNVTVPYKPELESSSRKVLVVRGTAYRQSGSASYRQKTYGLDFRFSGKDKAKEVADFFGIQPHYRHHPKHCLGISFIPAKEKFATGERVELTFRIKNLGDNTIAFLQGGRYRGTRDNQYIFSARFKGKQVNDVGTSYHFGGLAVTKVLKPGDVFEDKVELNKWFAFEQEGFYQILGSYYMKFLDPQELLWWGIWEDYVSAEFTVIIEGKKGTSNKSL